jgi:hypothetical protein
MAVAEFLFLFLRCQIMMARHTFKSFIGKLHQPAIFQLLPNESSLPITEAQSITFIRTAWKGVLIANYCSFIKHVASDLTKYSRLTPH